MVGITKIWTWKKCGWRIGRHNGRKGEGCGRDGDGYEVNRWEDTVSKIILGTDPNDLLVCDTILELHHLIMSMSGGYGGWLERERDK